MRALLPLALVTVSLSSALAAEPVPSSNLFEVLATAMPESLALQGKVVYVDFWASWCVPCRKSFPWMETMAYRYKDDGLQFVTVNLDTKQKLAQRFLDELHVTLPVVYDPEGELADKSQLEAMPTALIFRRDGTLAERHEGFHEEDREALESLLERLLAEEVKP